jgi:hypothetical protein
LPVPETAFVAVALPVVFNVTLAATSVLELKLASV